MRYAVLHTVRVGQKVAQRRVKLVVTGVPERTERAKVMAVLEAAGWAVDFSEAGIAWGNHEVKDADHLPAGTTDLDDAQAVGWSALVDERAVRRITLRLESELYARVVLAAARDDLRIQGWCENTLREAVARSEAAYGAEPSPADQERVARVTRRGRPRRTRTTTSGK